MTTHTSMPNRATLYLCALFFLPNALAFTQCANGVCASFNDNPVQPVAVIAGVVIGVVLLLSIVGIIFAVVRHRRIRRFQRTYVQNARANATVTNMVAPTYPSPAYASTQHTHHHHHNHAMDNHNLAVQQANMQNNQFTTSGFGGMSGSTGMTGY
ncbi:hypothetical protein B0H19DRAFT_1135744 [Mycena capillaripes]|nr:hypothetical protein B0H19DRAFT_1135744 [Mycena capillaripes]